MIHRNPSSLGRTLAIALTAISVASWVLPEVASHGQPAGSPAPAANPERAAAPEASADDAGTPAAAPSPAARKPAASRADCERYARVLAGRDKDPELLKQAEAPATARRTANADLVTCTAVLADSDEPCTRLDKETADNCRRDRAVFHEMRAYPNGRSFMLDDRKFEECKQNAAMAPVCEALRKALRSGDPSQCVLKADFEAICRSAGDLDVSKCATEAPQLKTLLEGQCRALVTLDESACDLAGPRHEEMAKQCRDDIKAGKAYGKGLKQLAKSGSPREKELAKAALKDPDACKAFTQSAVDACLQGNAHPAPAGEPRAVVPGEPDPASAPPAATPRAR
jgi:hypothetical protein